MSFFEQALLAQDDDAADAETDLFSHSHGFLAIAAESSRSLSTRPNADPKAEERGRKHSKQSDRRKDKPTEVTSSSKRRRITLEDGAVLLHEVGLSPVSPSNSRDRSNDQPSEPSPMTPSRNTTTCVVTRQSAPNHLHLWSRASPSPALSDEEVEITSWKKADSPAPAPPKQVEEEEEDSDPEFAALQRRARERRKQTLAARAEGGSSSVAVGLNAESPDLSLASPSPPDPPISILITSPIPNTSPLIVRRLLSQRLQEVREAWCARQGFSPAFTSQVFLTHRGLRRYNVTTCRSLGLEVDATGRVYLKDDPSKENVEQVHVEAMTEELFQQAKRAKAELQVGLPTDDDMRESAASQVAGNPQRGGEDTKPGTGPGIRIIVQTKDRKEFRVEVQASTTFAKIMLGSKKVFNLPKDQDVYLEFDGERLDPDDCVGNSEIEDMNCLDFYCGT